MLLGLNVMKMELNLGIMQMHSGLALGIDFPVCEYMYHELLYSLR